MRRLVYDQAPFYGRAQQRIALGSYQDRLGDWRPRKDSRLGL